MKYFKKLFLTLAFLFSLNSNLFADFGDTVKGDSSTRIDIGTYFNYVQRGMPFYGGTSSGAANNYTLSFSEAPSTFVAGQRYYFKTHQANTGNVLIQIGATTKSLFLLDGSTQIPVNFIKSGDFVEIVYDGTAFRLLSGNDVYTQLVNSRSGWSAINETWTYASATTITVPSGADTRYRPGDKLVLTNSTVKYFYITGVTSTVLTVYAGTDYTLANAAISAMSVSRAENPLNFPTYFNYNTPTLGTVSGSLGSTTIYISQFKIDGGYCDFIIHFGGTLSGANSNYLTSTLPVNGVDTPNGTFWIGGNYAINGATETNGQAMIADNSNLVRAYRDANAQWTTGGVYTGLTIRYRWSNT